MAQSTAQCPPNPPKRPGWAHHSGRESTRGWRWYPGSCSCCCECDLLLLLQLRLLLLLLLLGCHRLCCLSRCLFGRCRGSGRHSRRRGSKRGRWVLLPLGEQADDLRLLHSNEDDTTIAAQQQPQRPDITQAQYCVVSEPHVRLSRKQNTALTQNAFTPRPLGNVRLRRNSGTAGPTPPRQQPSRSAHSTPAPACWASDRGHIRAFARIWRGSESGAHREQRHDTPPGLVRVLRQGLHELFAGRRLGAQQRKRGEKGAEMVSARGRPRWCPRVIKAARSASKRNLLSQGTADHVLTKKDAELGGWCWTDGEESPRRARRRERSPQQGEQKTAGRLLLTTSVPEGRVTPAPALGNALTGAASGAAVPVVRAAAAAAAVPPATCEEDAHAKFDVRSSAGRRYRSGRAPLI